MSPHLKDNPSLADWLRKSPDGTQGLLARAHRLMTMNQALRHWCSEPWISQIRIANVRADVVVLYSTSAAALVPLRSRQSALLDYLNSGFNLACHRIEAKVRPSPR